MKIKLTAGILMRSFFDFDCVELELEEGAKLQDLLKIIARTLASRVPDKFWDKETENFQNGAFLYSGGKVLADGDQLLFDGQDIRIYRFMPGG